MFSATTEPALSLPGFNQKTRQAGLQIYQAFTIDRTLLLAQVPHIAMFVLGVLSGVYQEKDPRNLLISFDLIRFILTNFYQEAHCYFDNEVQESQFAEDIYDAVACYFPINFTPPQNDTFKVKPETLKKMLSDCFTASPKLVNHFVPFLLEKLSAKQVDTKLETLDLLSEFALKFSTYWLTDKLQSNILSIVSNLFFKDVSSQNVQPKAGRLIGLILDKMVPRDFDYSVGIKSELCQFLDRCVSDI